MPDTNPTPVDSAEWIIACALADRERLDYSDEAAETTIITALREQGYEIVPARAAIPGPDSRDAERAVTLAFADVSKLPEWMQVPALGRDMTPLGELAVAALRAAGLLPGPDTIIEINDADREAGVDHWIRVASWWNDQCREAWTQRRALIAENERLRSPDTITVNREALADLLGFAAFGSDYESDGDAHRRYWAARHRLRAALSEPPAPKEQQP